MSKMISDLLSMTKVAHLGPKNGQKAQNDPQIRPEINSLNTENVIKSKLFVYISIL